MFKWLFKNKPKKTKLVKVIQQEPIKKDEWSHVGKRG